MATTVEPTFVPDPVTGADTGRAKSGAGFRRAFLANRVAVAGLIVIVAMIAMAALAPLIAPYDPLEQDLPSRFQGPSAAHLLGTDELGRDILSRLMYGGRASLTAGLLAATLATVLGTSIGLVAGFLGGRVDNVLMRLMDVVLAFPSILLAIVVVTILGPSLTNALLAVGVITTPQMARVVRSSVLTLRGLNYIEASATAGTARVRIMFGAILPNCLGPLIVQATLTVAVAILEVASLSFLGLGAQAPSAEWGAMLTDAFRSGYGVFVNGQHAILFPGLTIFLAVLAVNFIGDGLRDAVDPKRSV